MRIIFKTPQAMSDYLYECAIYPRTTHWRERLLNPITEVWDPRLLKVVEVSYRIPVKYPPG